MIVSQELSLLRDKSSMAPMTLNAHQSELACLALNNQGTLLATGSVLVMLQLISIRRCENL